MTKPMGSNSSRRLPPIVVSEAARVVDDLADLADDGADLPPLDTPLFVVFVAVVAGLELV